MAKGGTPMHPVLRAARAAPPRWRRIAAFLAGAALLGAGLAVPAATPQAAAAAAACGTTNLALNHPATASSLENATFPASNAVDGNLGTRWSSAFSDPQWLEVDLGSVQSICQVTLNWEAAYGKAFQIQTSTDNATWTPVFSTTTGTGGTQTLTVSGSGRYIRMFGTARGTQYGYSLFEFQVFGTGSGGGGCGTANIALNHPATASSLENATFPASNAVDGNTGTRWSSQFSDPQWLQVDLGSTQSICQVVIQWETASGKAYQIQVSNDAANWTTIYSTTTGPGGTETLNITGTGRYIRMYGTARNTGYGYSIWEFQVFTGTSPSPSPSGSPSPSPSPSSTGGNGSCSDPIISAFQPVKASSYNGANAPAAALDGSTTTRWESQYSDPQWLQ